MSVLTGPTLWPIFILRSNPIRIDPNFYLARLDRQGLQQKLPLSHIKSTGGLTDSGSLHPAILQHFLSWNTTLSLVQINPHI